jgi:hypothetical protein
LFLLGACSGVQLKMKKLSAIFILVLLAPMLSFIPIVGISHPAFAIISVVTFNSTPAGGNWTVPAGVTSVEVLVVGGGGGGGSGYGGGGGAGGLVYNASYLVTAGTNVTVSVGAGGNGGAAGSASNKGSNGTNSSFGTIIALGGGFGSAVNDAGKGGNGGSGGGSGGASTGVYDGGTKTQGNSSGIGYGNNGGSNGNSAAPYPSGGGGGAGTVGGTGNGSICGDGGIGLYTYSNLLVAANAGQDIAGVHWIAGGGGGGRSDQGSTRGFGGAGGGGNGSPDATKGTAGTANTGGGGGGGGNTPYGGGGVGGSGIIVISYGGAGNYLTTAVIGTGSVSPSDTTGWNYNQSVSIVATNGSCYHFQNWTGDTGTITDVNAASTTINMTTTNKSITANFAINTYTLTYDAGATGTINGTTPQTVNCGSNGSAVTAIANTNYYFLNWSDAASANPRTDLNVSTNITVTANFAAIYYGSPTVLACNAYSNSIVLYWTKGANASSTYIRYKPWAYPTSSTDGYAMVNQSGNSYTQTGLASGTSYYFRLWGLEGGNLSVTNTTTMCTTTVGLAVATPNPLPSPNMSGATTAPNGSALTNNPLYGLGNLEAAAISVPQGTWWMLVGMGGLVVTGLFVYTRAKKLVVALGVMIIFGVIMAQMGLFPIWTMYVFGLAGIGMSWKELR